MSASTDYSLLTALERELGRERVRAIAQAYLRGTTAPILADLTLSPVLGPAPGGGPVTPPGFDYGPPLPGLRMPPPLAADYEEPSDDVVWPSAAEPLTPPLPPAPALSLHPSTPPRLAAAPTSPPGAPARPARPAHSTGGLGLMRTAQQVAEEAAEDMDELRRTDPENPLLCPRHRPVPLGPSRNSSGNWGFYGPPPSSGCRHCQADDREDRFRNAMWAALARAEHEPTVETVRAVEGAMAAFDAEGYHSCDRTYVERGLERVRAAMEGSGAAGGSAPPVVTAPATAMAAATPFQPSYDWVSERQLCHEMLTALWRAQRERTTEAVEAARAALAAHTEMTREIMPMNLVRNLVTRELAAVAAAVEREQRDFVEAADEAQS